MTREEAIQNREDCLKYLEGIGREASPECIEAVRWSVKALKALRPVSREQVEKVPRCEHCKDGKSFDGQVVIMGNKGMFPLNFCPRCGSPLTDEAVEMVLERLNKLED